MEPSDIACHALTPQGADLARRIATALHGTVYLPRRFAQDGEHAFDALAPHLAATFRAHSGHVFIAAAGIVVRGLAPLLGRKDTDPAVVVCDQHGAYAISLLSGHLGGANDLARHVAHITGGHAVITTATDTAGLPSLDMAACDAGCAIRNLGAVKAINGALLEGRPVMLFDPQDRLGLARHVAGQDAAGDENAKASRTDEDSAAHDDRPDGGPTTGVDDADAAPAKRVSASHAPLFRCVADLDTLLALPHDVACVAVTWRDIPGTRSRLVLHPPVIHAGIGCRRGAGVEAVARLLDEALRMAGAASHSLAALHTVDIKGDEPALHAVAAARDVRLHCHAAASLAAIEVPNPTPKAAEVLGTGPVGVCEAAAILGSGGGRLLVEKMKGDGVTVALALRS